MMSIRYMVSRKTKRFLLVFFAFGLIGCLFIAKYTPRDSVMQPAIETNKKDLRNSLLTVSQLPNDNVKKGFLLSYMRAGTTFVGSPFGRNYDLFYFFEPEWAFYFNNLNEYAPLRYIGGKSRDPVWMDNRRGPVTELLQNFLRCNFTGVDITSLMSRFHQESHHLRPFFDCVRKFRFDLNTCVENITRVCKSKNIRFAKTVRVRMDVAEELMKADPNLRVLHLIRDPRGIAVSRIGWGEVYRASTTFTMGRVCAEILRDIETVENMDSALSDRVLPVLYEDIAENPDVMFQSLYSFLQIPQPDVIKTFVRSITHGTSDASKAGFNTQRANSTKTAHSWRSKIAWKLCAAIDSMCGRVYDKIGVIKAKDEKTLRDYNVSLRLHPNHKDTYMYNFRKFL